MIPQLSELPKAPRAIVLHWTGGVYTPNRVDLEHYHYLVQEDEALREGKFAVAANMGELRPGRYAAHTGGMNTRRVGLAFCGERDDRHPLTERQIRAGIRAAAAMCYYWQLDPARPDHLFTHREAWTIHKVRGTRNHQKRDIDVLRFKPELEADEVGPWLRAETAALLEAFRRDPKPPEVVITG